MKMTDVLRRYDYDLPLIDAMNNPDVAPETRALAGVTVGIDLEEAYFAVSELEEAFEALARDVERGARVGEGYLMMEAVLDAKNRYQMRLWHILEETPLDMAADSLRWLKVLVYQRMDMARLAREQGVESRYWTSEEGREAPHVLEVMGKVAGAV